MKEMVVLHPGFGVGHLNPMVELAKVFLRHGLDVTVILIEPPVKQPTFSATVDRFSSSNPLITFHVLPPVVFPPDNNLHRFLLMMDVIRRSNHHLLDFLRSLGSVRALILDMFCDSALDVAAELNLPVYFFFASGAADLAVFLHLPTLQANTNASFKDLGDTPLSLPGVPPFTASHLPKEVLDRESEAYKLLFRVCERMPKSNGILVNTFGSLESRAVRALKDGICIPGHVMPPVYCIGPLVTGGEEKREDSERHECLAWLDAQPEQSVVFLCFGSMGSFSAEQLMELAVGLERSGQRFLWVVRSPRSKDPTKHFEPLPEPNLQEHLPEGFLDRTKDRGFLVKSWAPQVDVLRHKATGAFVTHCGWNSTLEGITAGLPLVCWPQYAEQKMNKVFIVEEMKVGVAMEGNNEELVTADEVENKVSWVIQSEGGKALRERAATMKEAAVGAFKEGGSSHAAFVEFLKDLENIRGSVRG